MLDRTRNQIYVSEELLSQDKFRVDSYHNPYLTKLTMKIHPAISSINSQQKFKLFNPLYDHDHISIRQSLPLYKSSKLLICLNWRQDLRNEYNLTHIGPNVSYNFNNGIRMRWKSMLGVSLLNDVEIKKQVKFQDNSVAQIYGSYIGFMEQQNKSYHNYQKVGLGIKYKNWGVGAYQRIDGDLNLRVNYEKLIKDGIYLQVKSDTPSQYPSETVVEAGVGYYWKPNLSMWLKTVFEPHNISEQQPSIGLQMQAKLKNDSFVASIEYKQNKSIIFLGYKCRSFNFIFPVCGIQSPIPAFIAVGLFIYGYFNRKRQIKAEKKQKQQADRMKQLKLISEKAGQIYRRQQTRNGLLIEQVYIGPAHILSEFLQQNERILINPKNIQYKNNIFDITVSFRFYVQKGELNLPKGSKLDLLGSFYHHNDNNQIYVRYIKAGKQYEQIFEQNDSILL